jgi:tetratricopeptide (TPR) repeat protein
MGLAFEDIYLTDFENVQQAKMFVLENIKKIRWGSCSIDECRNCIYALTGECQGGCLGHKSGGAVKVIGRKELGEFLAGGAAYGFQFQYPEPASIEMALAAYRERVKKDSTDVFAWYSIGRCYEALDMYDDAIAAYERTVEIDRKHIIATGRLNLAYHLKTLSRRPDNKDAWTRLKNALNNLFCIPEIAGDAYKQYETKFKKR